MPKAPADKPPMAARVAVERLANPLGHTWIVAAEVALDTKTAKRAAFRGSFRTDSGMRIDALETYCKACRRPYDDVADEDCSAKINNEHLIGGDPGVREKRIKHVPVGRIVKSGPITRRGMAGYSVHAGK